MLFQDLRGLEAAQYISAYRGTAFYLKEHQMLRMELILNQHSYFEALDAFSRTQT